MNIFSLRHLLDIQVEMSRRQFYDLKFKGDIRFRAISLEVKSIFLKIYFIEVSVSSVQSLSRVQLFATPWTAACQASLSITNSPNPPKPMSIELVMPSSHLILCRPLLLPSILLSIRVSLSVSLFLFCRYVDLCHILFYFNIYFFWLFWVLVVALRIFSGGMWTQLWHMDLVSWPEMIPRTPLHWECGVLATGPPRNSLCSILDSTYKWYHMVFVFVFLT